MRVHTARRGLVREMEDFLTQRRRDAVYAEREGAPSSAAGASRAILPHNLGLCWNDVARPCGAV